MVKNDYRRSLIMLRAHAQGYSGHVRLERRTLMGSLFVSINAPSTKGTLCAALIRRNARGAYAAARLGTLRRDGRGQAGLAYSFDPRNIDGAALEDYWLIAIVHTDQMGACELVLTGNVNGSREVEWNGVREAACDACRESSPPACEFCPQRGEKEEEPGEDERGDDHSRERNDGEERSRREPEDEEDEEEEEEEEEPPCRDPRGDDEHDRSGSELPADDLPETPSPSSARTDECAESTAAEILGLDPRVPWPGVAEQVRQYFAGQPPRELMLNDGYTYVSAPMPEGSGYDRAEIGLKVEEGVPVAMACALPSRYTPEPPPGLENYVWKGGAADGWWTIEMDVYTGERLM